MASSARPPDGREVSDTSGMLRVWLSDTGLPLHVQIAPPLLCDGADLLAAEVMRLCGRAAP